MDKPKMISNLYRKIEQGTESDLWNCPDNAPEYMPYTIAALVLTDMDLKKVPEKVIELLKKQIEHDLAVNESMKQNAAASASKLKHIFSFFLRCLKRNHK